MDIGCVLLAAGNSHRFGENKLLKLFQGKPLIAHALDTVPIHLFSDVVVVTQYPAIMDLASQHGFSALHNDQPHLGLSHSLQMGLTALRHCDGVAFLVCDQPLLRSQTLQALVALFLQNPTAITLVSHDGVRGNPCIFPADYFPALMALTGDQGGAQVIRQHSDALRLLDIDPRELYDIDHPEALQAIQETI